MTEESIKDVCTIIQTESDSINWDMAMHLIDILLRDRTYDRPIFQAIHDLAISGDRKIRLNAISFIDALFKNGNQELLTALQCSPSILGIAEDPIISDPYIHRKLCSYTESWVSVCKGKHCLMVPFLEWQRRLFSFKYNYLMTPEMIAKFSNDFSLSFELLSLFSQHLIAAKSRKISPDDEILVEMITNISEVHNRLNELKETMHDKYAISIINYLVDFCDICQQCYQSYSSVGDFDVDLLQEMLLRNFPNQYDSRGVNTQANSNGLQKPIRETNQNLDMIEDLIDLGDDMNKQAQNGQNIPAPHGGNQSNHWTIPPNQ